MPPVVSEDCHNDCDSSSSGIDDDGDIALSSCKKSLPFDLNCPPLDDVDFNSDDLQCTALCLRWWYLLIDFFVFLFLYYAGKK
ncbi:hypothetical protein Pint_03083 [Pistacia integerrima]|uniref:Uncharacterized protein n=1 Tax=Pistacia integerrima TaxID=434235 RepID=A0ACC0ZMG5_9ROSI|nr:hypothetical protein Pint_03083 [Pistacia integerrima]